MTTQQTLPSSMDEAGLTALYEAGLYTQALDTIEEAGLLTALEEQPDAPGHARLALLVANLYRELANYTPAEQYYLQALAGLTRTLGHSIPVTPAAWSNSVCCTNSLTAMPRPAGSSSRPAPSTSRRTFPTSSLTPAACRRWRTCSTSLAVAAKRRRV